MELEPRAWIPPPLPDDISLEARAFLGCTRIALVGASAGEAHFSRTILHALQGQGYDVVSVNRRTNWVDGLPAYPSVRAIPEPVEAAYIAVGAHNSVAAIRDCIAADVEYVWFHKGAGDGAVDPEALRLAQEAGLVIVPGACVLMCLRSAGWIHQVHRGLAAVTGQLP